MQKSKQKIYQNKQKNKIDNQQGPTLQRRELCSIYCDNLNRRRDTCIYTTESLCYTLETNTILLISYESENVSWSVVSDSLQPHGLQPARLLCPWNSPGNNTGVGCHFFSPGNLPDPEKQNLGLPHYKQILYHLSHQGNPLINYIPK